MVAPISGPFNKSVNTSTVYLVQRSYKQAKPVDRPLAYFTEGCVQLSVVSSAPETPTIAFGGMPNGFDAYADLFNVSYERLKGQMSSQAAWAVNLAEYNQSLKMMTARLVQIARFMSRLRKLDFLGAASVLGLDGKPSRVSRRKRFADNWLEYSFGWKPLIEDIYSTVDLLQTPIKSIRLKGSASASWFFDNNPSAAVEVVGLKRTAIGLRKVRQGCEVTINNPNLYLANNLGLTNPAVVAWELIPFSFVVDWFANVSEFLSSGTDFLGLTVSKPWRSAAVTANIVSQRYNEYSSPPYSAVQHHGHYCERQLSLSGVTFMVRPARLWGWQRAANAASVLTQALSRK